MRHLSQLNRTGKQNDRPDRHPFRQTMLELPQKMGPFSKENIDGHWMDRSTWLDFIARLHGPAAALALFHFHEPHRRFE